MQGEWGVIRNINKEVIGGFYEWSLLAPITNSFAGPQCLNWELTLWKWWMSAPSQEVIIEAYNGNGLAFLEVLTMPRGPVNDGMEEDSPLTFVRKPETL